MFASSYFRSVFRRFLTMKEWRTTWILRGCSKPLYEAPDSNCDKISQSGHQIGDNFIPKSNLVSIQFNFQWKVIHQKLSEQALVSWSSSVTRQLRNRIFWHQKYPKIRWKSLVLTKEKTKIITLSNQATAQPLGKIQIHRYMMKSVISIGNRFK